MPEIAEQKRKAGATTLAMVALYDSRLPHPDHYRQCLAQNFPDLPHPVSVTMIEEDRAQALSVETSESTGIIAVLPAPIPWADLEGPCSTAWWWPEAAEKLKPHTAHAIIAVTPKHKDDAIASCLIATKLTACLASTANAAGVYWGNGTLVHSAETFMEHSRGAGPDHLPLSLWIDFRLQRTPDGRYQLLTTGLESLNKREIEIAPCALRPIELLETAYDIAHYALTSGAEIRDGDTIGRSESHKIRISFAKSMWDRPGDVMRLEVPEGHSAS